MKLTYGSLLKIVLLTSIAYYCGFLFFALRLVESGSLSHGTELMESNASGSSIKQVIGLILFGISGVLVVRLGKYRLFFILKENLAWMLLIGYLAFSISWSVEPTISMRRIIGLLTVIFTCLALCLYFQPSTLLILIADAIVLAACIGLVLFVVNPTMATAYFSDRGLSFVGMFFDKNAGARAYAYAFIILVSLNQRVTKVYLCKLAILGGCLIFAKSASAAILLLGGLGIVFLLKNMQSSEPKKNLKHSVIFCLILGTGALLASWLYPYVLELFGRDANLTNRTIIWELLSIEIAEKPVYGYGFGAFWASTAVNDFVERWGFIGNAHSGYYEMLLNGGFIGLCLLCFLMLVVLVQAFSLYNKGNSVGTAIVVIALLQYLANYVGYVFLNYNNFDMFLFCLLAFSPIAIKLYGEEETAEDNNYKSTPHLNPVS
ncbi:O-antigen ligase family protein [Alteromonas confluentis]|uniref:O-antigen ligase-related domain-containing protein n=1 Tax=Alteromonas confluentis TaxID=1656094 RepID=A0A1E7ZF63_9ALTE|nr:O-antigen ligase family protein [Alteromonas confluentis]OFC72151.1 hypothetical protein BFC18_05480 [Alteromonas confluentis]